LWLSEKNRHQSVSATHVPAAALKFNPTNSSFEAENIKALSKINAGEISTYISQGLHQR